MQREVRSTEHSIPAETAEPAVGFGVDRTLAGQRLDRALAASVAGLSRTRAQAAIAAGTVMVDGRPAKSSLLLEPGMRVVFAAAEPRAPVRVTVTQTAPPLRVVFEDAHILVVDKAAGVVVHPAPGHASGTLVDAVLAHVPDLDAGDDASPKLPLPPRQFLHPAHLEFAHPISGEWLVFDVPLPKDLAAFLAEWER